MSLMFSPSLQQVSSSDPVVAVEVTKIMNSILNSLKETFSRLNSTSEVGLEDAPAVTSAHLTDLQMVMALIASKYPL